MAPKKRASEYAGASNVGRFMENRLLHISHVMDGPFRRIEVHIDVNSVLPNSGFQAAPQDSLGDGSKRGNQA